MGFGERLFAFISRYVCPRFGERFNFISMMMKLSESIKSFAFCKKKKTFLSSTQKAHTSLETIDLLGHSVSVRRC
jgi:hypothetical protein